MDVCIPGALDKHFFRSKREMHDDGFEPGPAQFRFLEEAKFIVAFVECG